MKIECTARIFEKRLDQAGKLSIRCSESKKDQGGQWVSVSSFWATVRGSAVNFINALDLSQSRKPLVILKGYLEGYGIKLPDGSYGRGYFSVVEASNPPFLANNQSAPTNAAPAPAAMPVNTVSAPAAPVAPQPMPAAPVAPQPMPAAPAPAPVMSQPVSAAPVEPMPMGGFGNFSPQANLVTPEIPAAAPVAPQPMPAAPAPAPAPQPAPVGQPVAAPNVTSFESQPSVTTNPFLKIS